MNTDIRNILFDGISPEWMELIDDDDEINKIIDELKNVPTSPAKENWFEFARRTKLKEVRVIIFGQDPYPTDAHGLAFSSLAARVPPSLRNIYDCLKNHGLARAKIPTNSDLTCWAQQGVLLINTALTTLPGQRSSHMNQWKPYMVKLIEKLLDYGTKQEKCYVVLLWGNFAQVTFGDIAARNHICLRWLHPSPMAQSRVDKYRKFISCDHFSNINHIFKSKPIDWDFSRSEDEKEVEVSTETSGIINIWRRQKFDLLDNSELKRAHIIFTDGSCTDNGKETARASYALKFVEGPLKNNVNCEELKSDKFTPTSPRGEGFGIYKALCILDENLDDWDEALFVSDSEFWVNMITRYMSLWPNDKFDKMKNPDLTRPIWDKYTELTTAGGKRISVEFSRAAHGQGWKQWPASWRRYCCEHNDEVDQMAKSVLGVK